MTTIFFDMDGTLADFYGVQDWLRYLEAEDTFPYKNAEPLLNLQVLARKLNKLIKAGYAVEIISWTAKHSTAAYDEAVATAKLEWLTKHLKSVKFQKINIVKYGTNKDLFRHTKNDILFDDEIGNLASWGGRAYEAKKILEVLKNE